MFSLWKRRVPPAKLREPFSGHTTRKWPSQAIISRPINGAGWCCLCFKVVPFPLLLAGESEEKLKLLFVSRTKLIVFCYGWFGLCQL